MDIATIQAQLKALQASAGENAVANLVFRPTDIHCFFRPQGWGMENPSILGYGDTPEAALTDAQNKWDEMSLRVRAETIKKLSVAIIRLTHEQGVCTDAALRATFRASDVEKYGAEAVALANTMAANGPFKILELAGANAA